MAAAGLALAAGLCVLAPVAAASEPIEAVWAFNGGEVAIVRAADGSYSGIVDASTTFASCPHTVGEQMWSEMRLQSDGTYWGLHQWFYESQGCQRNPTLGPAAWRVMSAPDGSRYLRVCFSQPGSTQPTIAPSGASAAVTYRCYESARLAPVPTGSSPASSTGKLAFAHAVTLPSARLCLRAGPLRIHLHDPPFDPIAQVLVSIRGHRVALDRLGTRFSTTIVLRHLPTGTFTVKVAVTTVLGHRLSGRRTYRTCPPRGARRASARRGPA